MRRALWTAACVAGMNLAAETVDLSGTWRLREADGREAFPIAVPGDVQTALFRAGKMVDPFWGANELKTQWIPERRWEVSRTFEVSAETASAPRPVLRLEDVDTFATVFLNGRELGRCGNRFARYDFNAKGALRAGANELRVVFESTPAEIRRRAEASPVKAPIADMGLYPYINYVRKPRCHQGWDWGLAQMVVGLCGKVELIAEPFTVDYVCSEQRFNADFTRCDLRVCVETTQANGRKVVYTNDFAIANPPLWWPNGMGEQRFYTCTLDVGGRKIDKRIGLRKIELVSEDEPDGGRSVFFRVNGRPVFAKGANWIPCSAWDNEQTPARYRDLLESARDANMNMIRVWGGGQFEKDAFYDLADELGLLLWHDFMFACETSPAERYTLDELETELAHQIRRLRDHASIALWCGDNECNSAHRWWFRSGNPRDCRWGPLPGGEPVIAALGSNYLGRVKAEYAATAKYDPARAFWPSSPSMGRFDDLQKSGDGVEGKGDMHFWRVWHKGEDFEKYYDLKVRFCSEFGFQSFSSPEVARTFCSAGDFNPTAPEFEHHQKNGGGNQRILETMARYFRFPMSMEGICYLSQVQQALAMKTAVEKWRSVQPYCMGALFWQLNDNWPVASWSSIEYGGKWKHLQYHAKRFFAPLAAFVEPVDSSFEADIELFAVNDTYEAVPAEVVLETMDFTGRVLGCERFRTTLGHGSTKLKRMTKASFGDEAARQAKFLLVTLTAGGRVFQNEFLFDRYKYAPLADAKVDAKVNGFDVVFTTDAPAFFVWANATGLRGEFTDNSFTLVPGRPKTVTFRPKDPSVTPASFKKAFSFRRLNHGADASKALASSEARAAFLL